MTFCGRKFLFQFTLIAFVFSAVMPFFALYNAQLDKTDLAQLEALYGEEVFICTERGFEWVKVADLAQGQHEPAHKNPFECALCFVSAKGAQYGAYATAVLIQTQHAASMRQQLLVDTPLHVAGIYSRPFAPRAPPSLS